jgi:hypothetical protein
LQNKKYVGILNFNKKGKEEKMTTPASVVLLSLACGFIVVPFLGLMRLLASAGSPKVIGVSNYFYPSVAVSALFFIAAAVTKYFGW